MKLRVLLVCLVALGLSASVAIAAPPPGKGKPASPGNSATAGKPSADWPDVQAEGHGGAEGHAY